MNIGYYRGYDVIHVKLRGPALKRAKYKMKLPLWLRRGLSKSHRAKLQKSYSESARIGVWEASSSS